MERIDNLEAFQKSRIKNKKVEKEVGKDESIYKGMNRENEQGEK